MKKRLSIRHDKTIYESYRKWHPAIIRSKYSTSHIVRKNFTNLPVVESERCEGVAIEEDQSNTTNLNIMYCSNKMEISFVYLSAQTWLV